MAGKLSGLGESVQWVAVALALTAFIGVIDYLTGYHLGFSLFYLVPISLATWKAGKRMGLVVSVAGAVTWFVADYTARGAAHLPLFIHFWNTGIRFSFFLVFVMLFSGREAAYRMEKLLARTDPLTGIRNRRAFLELVTMEAGRLERTGHGFSVAYLDCDNFKAVNDRSGHGEGDRLLVAVAETLRCSVRTMDVTARIGGDEFAVLMPETTESSALEIASRLQKNLLEKMGRHGWPVTFSVGMVTCSEDCGTAEDVLARADALMYSAKGEGKNTIVHASHPAVDEA
jgi:diguanylate cyclase (GGDEF)-like protein